MAPRVMPISSGDTLIAFTDGVSEAMNGKRKMFRSDGIIEVLQANAERPSADHPGRDLVSSSKATSTARPGHDDRSLMVIRVQ